METHCNINNKLNCLKKHIKFPIEKLLLIVAWLLYTIYYMCV